MKMILTTMKKGWGVDSDQGSGLRPPCQTRGMIDRCINNLKYTVMIKVNR